MNKACTIKPHVRNSNNEVVESRLFNDLLNHTSDNRAVTTKAYNVATNSEFQSHNEAHLQYDDLQEPTLNSFLKVVKIDMMEEELLTTLNKEIGAGQYSYVDAISKLQNFNRENAYNEDYMATIKIADKDKYELSVVPKTSDNEVKLEKVIAKRSYLDRVLYYTNKMGVSVDFLTPDHQNYNGRYSTENAESAVDGLVGLIQVINDGQVDERLSHEVGHFALGALGNSAIVHRFQSLMTPEVIKGLFGDEVDNIGTVNVNMAREAAGRLVGQYLMDTNDPGIVKLSKMIRSFLERIKNRILSIGRTEEAKNFHKSVMEVNQIAKKIANGYMSHNFNGTLQNALSITETLYDFKETQNKKLLRDVINRLRLHAHTISGINKHNAKPYFDAVGDLANLDFVPENDPNNPQTINDITSLAGVASSVHWILGKLMHDMPKLLDQVDYRNTRTFRENLPENARKLQEIRAFVTTSMSIIETVNSKIRVIDSRSNYANFNTKEIKFKDVNGREWTLDLEAVLEQCAAANSALVLALNQKEKQLFVRFCEDIYGRSYVERFNRLEWKKITEVVKDKNGNDTAKIKHKTGVRAVEGSRIELADYVEELSDDINMMYRYIGSMCNNPDVIGQIADKSVKDSRKIADSIILRIRNDLRVLLKAFKKLNVKSDIFYERYADGTLTGNLISEYHYGNYEKAQEDHKKYHKDLFIKAHPEWVTWLPARRAMEWSRYYKPYFIEWSNQNSIKDEVSGRWVPNLDIPEYKNPKYEELEAKHPEALKILRQIKNIKAELDSFLEDGATSAFRAPQVRGRFTDKMNNRKVLDGAIVGAVSAYAENIHEMFCETSDDIDMGTLINYTEEEMDENLDSDYKKSLEDMYRLPTYGIRKLKNMNNLSTDIFYAMLSYANMATSYKALKNISDILILGKEVLSRRKVKSFDGEKYKHEKQSRAFSRYCKFVDMQVFNIYAKRMSFGKIVVNKLAHQLDALAAVMFLYGNLHGAFANVLQGFTEIFKEAGAAEHFNLKNWYNANMMFAKDIVPATFNMFNQVNDNKLSLMLENWNSTGKNEQNFRSWHTNRNDVHNFLLENSMMWQYSLGERYMQGMVYLALADNTIVYDKQGKPLKLVDAYKKVDINEKDSKSPHKIELQDVYITPSGHYEVEKINKLLTVLRSELFKKESDRKNYVINVSAATVANIKNMPLNIAAHDSYSDTFDTEESLKDYIYLLEEYAEQYKWGLLKEADFVMKARAIANNLHGVYNKADKVAIQGNIYGQMALTFKGYALGMIERRWGTSKNVTAFGREEHEGNMQTMVKLLFGMIIPGLWNGRREEALLALRLGTPLLYLKGGREAAKNAGMSHNQYHNVGKFYLDVMMQVLLAIGISATAQDKDEEEQFRDDSLGFYYYFLNRLYIEQAAYWYGYEVYKEIRNIADVVPIGIVALTELISYVYLAGQTIADPDDVENSNVRHQTSGGARYDQYDYKLKTKTEQKTPFLKSEYISRDFYKSTESYEGGRNMKK